MEHSLTPSVDTGWEINHATLLQLHHASTIFGPHLTRIEDRNMGLEALIAVPIILFAVFALIIHGGW